MIRIWPPRLTLATFCSQLAERALNTSAHLGVVPVASLWFKMPIYRSLVVCLFDSERSGVRVHQQDGSRNCLLRKTSLGEVSSPSEARCAKLEVLGGVPGGCARHPKADQYLVLFLMPVSKM